ncbi:MAG: ABC transporter permease [Fimbriimonadaceae bacterium]|nr:ABC transporter permease [Fimbriimonadaceae bacterium]
MLLVLLGLGAVLSLRTLAEQRPTGVAAATALQAELAAVPAASPVLVVGGPTEGSFVDAVAARLTAGGAVVWRVLGEPRDARQAVEAQRQPPALIVAGAAAAGWPLWQHHPRLRGVPLLQPPAYRWPTFLLRENLLNVANQIAVIAILAVGMTFVILTGGIDLSVGSLIALAAVAATVWLRGHGGVAAGGATQVVAALLALTLTAAVGYGTGWLVTGLSIPPFIVTLAVMLVASGAAYMLADGQSIYQVPASFTALGRGTVAGLPVAVLLMLTLYAAAHLFASRTALGRRIYAVGGNREAARLSGVRERAILRWVYTLSGLLAGLGGVVTASQLQSGSPTYGQMYELYVIAAVVVGGTSLSGGSGSVLGTLIGACLIAVIQNGMNLIGVQSYTQKVVLGLVILGSVLLDRLRAAKASGKWS